MKDTDKLTRKQALVMVHILNSSSIEEACQKAGISRGAYYLWLKDDNFKAELKRQRKELINEGIDRLKCAVNKAVDRLIELVGSSKEEVSRLAANSIIIHALKSIELEEVEERLAKIEEHLQERGNR